MKRTLALLLVLAMLSLSLLACGNPKDTTFAGDTTAAPSDTTAQPEEEKIPRPDIAKENNNGEEFMVLHEEAAGYIFADDPTGDNVSAALYERNIVIEEWLGVVIKHYISGNYTTVYPELQRAVLAQEDTYDMVATHSTNNIANILAGKYVLDLRTVESIDLEAPYWNQSSVALFERNGAVPLAVNDFLVPSVNVILFNPDLHAEAGLEDLYDVVRKGEWTLDKMFEMAGKVYKDDGDGQKNDKDTFGLICAPDWKVASIQHACGQMIIDNVDGEPQYVIFDEHMIDILDKYNSFFHGQNAYGTTVVDDMNRMFAEGKGLFYLESMSNTIQLRSIEMDFGILPIPKWDVSQDKYLSTNWNGYLGIPSTVQNVELAGKVMELLGYESRVRVWPEFFDVLLGQKLAANPDCQEMLEIVFENTIFDLGITLNMRKIFQQMIIANSSDLASKWASEQGRHESELQKFITAYDGYFS